MARAITKTFGTSETIATIKRFVDGKMCDETYTLQGHKSRKAVQLELKKTLKTSNFMITSCDENENENEETYTVDADTFYALAKPCEGGVSYGREYVTTTFKLTVATYYTEDGNEHEFEYLGTTTDSKLRRAICEDIENDNILVGNVSIIDYRCYMAREEFTKVGTKK